GKIEALMFSISDTIRDSLKLAWQHKILWIFALLVAGSTYNSNSNISDLFSEETQTSTQEEQHLKDIPLFEDRQGSSIYNNMQEGVLGATASVGSYTEVFFTDLLDNSVPYILLVTFSIV